MWVTSPAGRCSSGISVAAFCRAVERRLGNRDHERDAGLARGERERVRAYLVGHVAVGRNPVGARRTASAIPWLIMNGAAPSQAR